MSVLISGSLAYDTVFEHEGQFSDHLLADQIAHLNLTFQASAMRRTLGGCAGNIAYSLRRLGGDPFIWTAVGKDITEYLQHLKVHDIRTDGITIVPQTYSAQAIITTDQSGCQLTTFYSGAMDYADQLPFPDAERNRLTLAILAPTTREPLLAHAKACQTHDLPYLLDTGQTTPLFEGETLLDLVSHSVGVCFSDYEAELYEQKTGLNARALSRLGTVVYQTHGEHGASVWINGQHHAIPTPHVQAVDPVGAGDAFRGGLLHGLTLGLSPIDSARLGCLMGAVKVQHAGPNYTYSLTQARQDWKTMWGEAPF